MTDLNDDGRVLSDWAGGPTDLSRFASQPDGAHPSRVSIFLDCDGVLADFDRAGEILFGMTPRDAERLHGSKRFWHRLEHEIDFYGTLPLMPDARALYDGVRHLNPTILTGCPRGTWAQGQKVAWAERNFPGVPIITCRSADKRDHAKPGDVLIDDWPQHRHRWIEMGGVFISHYDAASSLSALWAHYPHLRDSDTRRMAETGRGSVRSTSSAGGAAASPDPRSEDHSHG